MSYLLLSKRLLILCLTLFATAACTMSQQPIGNPENPYPSTESPAVGEIFHLSTGVKVSAEAMYASVTDARIVYVGETHDNPAAHRLELQILKAMAERHPGQVTLGLEMFNQEQQTVLDEWIAGTLSEKAFLKRSDWYNVWTQDFAYYRDILNFARDQKIPTVGLNITKKLRQTVGMARLEDIDEETRARLPEMDLNDSYQRAVTEAIYADHGQGSKMLDGFLRIQTLWDEAMAENIVRTLQDKDPGQRMVVMAGGNHVRYGFGIPRRVFRRLPISYILVGSRELVVPEEKRDRLMNVDMPRLPMTPYDYLLYTEYESLPGERVKLGVRMKEEQGTVVVEEVVTNSTADQAGVLSGDIIVALDETPITDSFDLIYEVNQRVSGDHAILTVAREGEELKLSVTFAPMPKTKNHSK